MSRVRRLAAARRETPATVRVVSAAPCRLFYDPPDGSGRVPLGAVDGALDVAAAPGHALVAVWPNGAEAAVATAGGGATLSLDDA